MSSAAFALGIWFLLTKPSHANRILTCLASTLQSEDPLKPLTLDTLNACFLAASLALTAGLPAVVADEAAEIAARALPTIHPGETPDAYAIRVTHAARSI
ncbi:hypothetical protein OG909_24820 [Streptomyces sp. NBC_01754]|uniref:hypothetical protein n=1 Tax=Streptomyces sp. NBC_01754 TaxID=2975930 RepID=UPI002DD960BF|nr:hypothetical protein [Streptomyces sp. NBC_01754]WSC95239.1 hypothetical protein OG909_24820 [Streptomyces sp. NBC_01754]